jgi:enoyl-CoA hydratase
VFPLAELLPAAQKMALEVASKGPLAIAAVKRVRGKGLAAEAEAFAGTFETHDQREGMTAFLEKRAAKFEGR